jgi:hypothetical protein
MRDEAMISGRIGRYRPRITVISAERDSVDARVERRREEKRSGAHTLRETVIPRRVTGAALCPLDHRRGNPGRTRGDMRTIGP